jgi:hypothetical protein
LLTTSGDYLAPEQLTIPERKRHVKPQLPTVQLSLVGHERSPVG